MGIFKKNRKSKLNENDLYEGEVNAENQPDDKGKLTCNGTHWYEQYIYERALVPVE